MNKFQDAYQEAAKELPDLHMDAGMAKDELHHYKMKRQRRDYLIVKGCTAATVFLLCGVGTAVAKSYRDSIIQVNDNGVTITARQMEEAEEEEGLIALTSLLERTGGYFP